MQKDYKENSLQIIKFLNEWDFLGVKYFKVKDEYDDLVGFILRGLMENKTASEMSELLSAHINKIYGVEPWEIDKFINNIFNWWNKKYLDK